MASPWRRSLVLLICSAPAASAYRVACLGGAQPVVASLPRRAAAVAVAGSSSPGPYFGPLRCRSLAPAMLEGGPPAEPTIEDEVFGSIADGLGPVDKALKNMPTLGVAVGANTAIGIAGLLAWVLLPSRVPAVLSVTVAGAATKQVGDRLKEKRRGLVPAAIADMVREVGLKDLNSYQVEQLAKRFDVTPAVFEEQLRSVYARFLAAVTEDEEVAASQISKLANLRRGLGLRWYIQEYISISMCI